MDYLTFSGNGEPTIHPDFPEIIRGVKEIKDRLRPIAKLAVFLNASRVNDPEVAAALRLVDAPMMKLDTGDECTFQAVNRPVKDLKLEAIISGLARLPILMIQSALFDGTITNVREEGYESWLAALEKLRPQMLHIYSTERPTAQEKINCLEPRKLEQMASDLRLRLQLNVQAFWGS